MTTDQINATQRLVATNADSSGIDIDRKVLKALLDLTDRVLFSCCSGSFAC